MDIFFLAEKKKRARNSNRINRTSETTLRDKEREGERKKSEGGWRNSNGRLSGRGGYAPARRDRAPFPSQRLNVDVFSPPLFLFLSFLFFPLPHPSPIPRFSLPFLVEIPRGAHSIIRYLCRTRHKSNPWQEKRPSLVHDGPRNAHPFLLLLSCHSSSPLPPFPNRCFAETRVRKSCHHSPIFPSRNAIPIPTRFPVKYLLSAWPD